ncbi:hypothetical protein FRX31_013515 [Thalictrum thalictroides]|uniref:Uncharacterized protein n=1 Tax=Thalictrum thalictroides TaxID=46969 RepID=A0A7J6WIX2_THATH|nr:hypothetical protein FRX31_013515 [Thalictrum thalictroides]
MEFWPGRNQRHQNLENLLRAKHNLDHNLLRHYSSNSQEDQVQGDDIPGIFTLLKLHHLENTLWFKLYYA